ncbi:hypothetical protein [Saccharothrix syringae]|uniref:Uncharacterized protein n=1 Tax=Saccharothrix syringae TaxID=103733 RepID=A0A5Q0HCC0_SACSY|nr:hypothetical protein [Saccharothrix syringae]QFZ23896.1 hypothetical protein EKG83_46380 [Saccharothrix syringae]
MSSDPTPRRATRSNRTPSLVIAGVGLLVLVVFGLVWPSIRAGGFAASGAVITGSVLVPAILLVFLGIWGRRGA